MERMKIEDMRLKDLEALQKMILAKVNVSILSMNITYAYHGSSIVVNTVMNPDMPTAQKIRRVINDLVDFGERVHEPAGVYNNGIYINDMVFTDKLEDE